MQPAQWSESVLRARRAAIAESIGRARGGERRLGVAPESLSEIKEIRLELANRREPVPQMEFPRERKFARLGPAYLFRASSFPLSRREPRFADQLLHREEAGGPLATQYVQPCGLPDRFSWRFPRG